MGKARKDRNSMRKPGRQEESQEGKSKHWKLARCLFPAFLASSAVFFLFLPAGFPS
jgi:hypothetical protein